MTNLIELKNNITNTVAAARDFVLAFFRAYDEEVGTDQLGYPLLAGWPLSTSPYEGYFQGIRTAPKFGPVRAALVFVSGQRLGEAVYLRDGAHMVGTACTNDVLIHVAQPTEARLTLQVTADGTLVSSDAGDTPAVINRHVGQYVTLVDQDECTFNKSQFYYVALPTTPDSGAS